MNDTEKTIMQDENHSANVDSGSTTDTGASSAGGWTMNDDFTNQGNYNERNDYQWKKTRRKGISKIAFRYTGAGFLINAAEIGIVYLLAYMAPYFFMKNMSTIILAIIPICTGGIGLPFIYFITRNNRNRIIPEVSKLTLGNKILNALFMAGIVGVGAIIGAILEALFGMFAKQFPLAFQNGLELGGLTGIIVDSPIWLRAAVVGIMAPIIEELIFRKILIDCMIPYGKKVAIIVSGLMFGLFHGNFSQGVFATGTGFLWAYIYVKTGKIRYSIGYHMLMNLVTSVGTISIVRGVVDTVNEIGPYWQRTDRTLTNKLVALLILLFVWFLILVGLAIAGFVLLIVKRKTFSINESEEPMTNARAFAIVFSNPGMWLFFGFGIVLFIF